MRRHTAVPTHRPSRISWRLSCGIKLVSRSLAVRASILAPPIPSVVVSGANSQLGRRGFAVVPGMARQCHLPPLAFGAKVSPTMCSERVFRRFPSYYLRRPPLRCLGLPAAGRRASEWFLELLHIIKENVEWPNTQFHCHKKWTG